MMFHNFVSYLSKIPKLLPVIFLFSGIVLAFAVVSAEYSVESYHHGLSVADGESSLYTLRGTLSYEQGGNINGTSPLYSVNLGWFSLADFISPSIVIISPENNSLVDGDGIFDLNYTATDNYLVIDSCWYSLNGASNITIPGCQNISILGVEGQNNITVYANDSAGNENASSTVTFIIDLNSPVVTIFNPQNITYNTTQNIPIDYTAFDDNLESCWYSINEGANTSLVGCLNTTINTTSGVHSIFVYANDSAGNIGYDSEYFIVLFNITLEDHYGLDSSLGIIDIFNTSNLEEIEYMELNFSIDSDETIDSWYLNFTSNGTNGCSLGNKQSSNCYSYTNDTYKWIQFINGTNTATYDGTQGNQGDRIIVTETGSDGNINLSFRIDEHYNPNVFKWYEAQYDFSEVKWQDGADQKITGNNLIKIQINQSIIPLDADQYKLDFRVNYTQGDFTPTKNLEAYICNSSYVSGHPHDYSGCTQVSHKMPYELQDDGTKFRGIFTQNLIDEIGDISYVVIYTLEQNVSKYYSIKTYNITNPAHTQKWEYSTDNGDTWNNSGDRYETELNINWFYDGGVNPTAFIYSLWVNTTNGTETFLEGNITWDIDPTNNYAPLVDLKTPLPGTILSLPYNITFTLADPNDDNLNATLYLYQGVSLNKTIATDMNQSNISYYWDDSTLDGDYDLVLEACELGTPDLFCVNITHDISVDNTAPAILVTAPENNSVFNTTFTYLVSLNYTVNEPHTDSCWYSLNGGENVTLSGCVNTTITAINGNNNVTVYVNDSFSRLNSSTVFFTLDIEGYPMSTDLSFSPSSVSLSETFNLTYNATVVNGVALNVFVTTTHDGGANCNNNSIANWTYGTKSNNALLYNLTSWNCSSSGTYSFNTTWCSDYACSSTIDTITVSVSDSALLVSCFRDGNCEGWWIEDKFDIIESRGLLWSDLLITILLMGLGLVAFFIGIMRSAVLWPITGTVLFLVNALYSLGITGFDNEASVAVLLGLNIIGVLAGLLLSIYYGFRTLTTALEGKQGIA